jgi:hypothetical protein
VTDASSNLWSTPGKETPLHDILLLFVFIDKNSLQTLYVVIDTSNLFIEVEKLAHYVYGRKQTQKLLNFLLENQGFMEYNLLHTSYEDCDNVKYFNVLLS